MKANRQKISVTVPHLGPLGLYLDVLSERLLRWKESSCLLSFFFFKSIAFFFSYIKIKHLGSCEDHCDLLAIQFVVKLSAINISLCDSLSHTPLPQWLRLLASLELVMILTC